VADKINAGKTKLSSQYTDRQVFEGVMFLQGPVAGFLGEFQSWNLQSYIKDQNYLNNLQLAEDNITVQLEQQTPGYLSQFRAQVTSGDLNLVTSALQDAAHRIANTSTMYDPHNPQYIQIGENFLNTYHITPQSSTSDIQHALVAATGVDQGGLPNGLTAACIAILIVAVVVVLIVLLWYADPNDQVSAFMTAEFASTVTLNLAP
jgi:SdpC family antimicrobial peptide